MTLRPSWCSEIADAQVYTLCRAAGRAPGSLPSAARTSPFRSRAPSSARCFVVGTQELPDLYGPTLDNFHALWEVSKSTPETVAAELKGKNPAKFVADFVKRCFKEGKMFQKGVARHAELDRNRAALRATLLRVLEELGAYERLNKKNEGR